MSYQALYRKWRPVTFGDVEGQDAVALTLKNQVKTGRIGHAYLFCGTRGTGKTTAAKIFARAVNCPDAHLHGGDPCNECAVCRSIIEGRSMDVFEIDAASNNGVDNIRDIREQIEYPSTEGKYKVYIIDEVHMLSTGAFNALLKTLEEPPSYVIFILATTDPQKIPQTILSRCQRYDFKRISKMTISNRLKMIAGKEGMDIEDRAFEYIASAADGSMRDALSIMDQCAAYHYGEKLTFDSVIKILGAADTFVYSDLFRAVLSADAAKVIEIIEEIISSGCEAGKLCTDFIWYLRNVLLSSWTGADSDIIDVLSDHVDRLKEDGKLCTKTRLIKIIAELSELSNRMRTSSQKRVVLEAELIRQCAKQLPEEKTVIQEIKPVSPKISINIDEIGETQEKKAELPEEPKPADAEEKEAEDAGIKTAFETIQSNWEEMLSELQASNRSLFKDVVLKDEKKNILIVFKNKINFKLAAKNSEENGLLKLREIAFRKYGISTNFTARIAQPGEIGEKDNKFTDEELGKINFPVDFEN